MHFSSSIYTCNRFYLRRNLSEMFDPLIPLKLKHVVIIPEFAGKAALI